MNLDIAVVGASLGGLSVANVLQRLGARVEVYECFGHGFHNRGGALGAVDVELVREIRGDVSRSGHSGPIKGHGHFYGDLWQYLYEGLLEGTVHFGVDVQEILDSSSDSPQLVIGGAPLRFDIIVGADGGVSPQCANTSLTNSPSMLATPSGADLCPWLVSMALPRALPLFEESSMRRLASHAQVHLAPATSTGTVASTC